jgi:hypothetical protein
MDNASRKRFVTDPVADGEGARQDFFDNFELNVRTQAKIIACVLTFKRQTFLPRWAHIAPKVIERLPIIANLNTFCPVPFVANVLGILAAFFHSAP